MTDKQIIIDGIDVSGCSYFNFIDEHYCDECSSEFGCAICDERTNCYYKQLKRKEQECEKFKKDLHLNFKEKDKLHLIIDRLLEASGYDTNTASAKDFEDVYKNMRYEKQQLDQLKAEKQVLIKDWEEKKNLAYKIACKNDKLKQTLAEIKEIANNAEEQCAIPENYFKRNNVSWKQHQLKGLTCKFKQILQKISECEAENE